MIEVFLLAAVVSVFFAVLGLFVVLRGESFLAAGLSHAAFGGAGLSLLLDTHPLATALAYTLSIAAIINKAAEKLSRDAAIGIIFAFSMALGILSVSLSAHYGDAMSYLFGSILSATGDKLLIIIAMFAIITAWIYFNWKALYYSSFDPEFCKARGIDVEGLDLQFLLIVATAIVAGMPVVGILLVSAFLIIPPSIALLFRKPIKSTLIITLLSSLISALGGVGVAYVYDLPPGSVIVLLLSAMFVAAYLWRGKHA